MPPTLHAILGASSAHRWMNCPGSVRLTRDIESTSSTYAEEGSAAHHLAEECLRKGKDANDYADRAIRKVGEGYSILRLGAPKADGDFEIDDEMTEAVQLYLDTIREDLDGTPGASLLVEHQFDLSSIYPGLFGTNDAAIAQPWGKCRVYDFKYGKGVAVTVENNPQLQYYALGASRLDDFQEIELVIVQPRARHKDGPVRRWELTAAELEKWALDSLVPAAKATEDPKAPLAAGTWCKFCPAGATCPARFQHAQEVIKSDFVAIELPSPERLGMTDLVRVLDSSDILTDWLRQVAAYADGLLKKGETIPGRKLVQKKTIRRWKDEHSLVSAMFRYREHIYEKKILSPAKMENLAKTQGWDIKLEQFWEKPDGGLVMAPESDRREAVQAAPLVESFIPVDAGEF